MRPNKNNVLEGDKVEYFFSGIEDAFNGAQGEVLEVIDQKDPFGMRAKVRWADGLVSVVPINNLYPIDTPERKAS